MTEVSNFKVDAKKKSNKWHLGQYMKTWKINFDYPNMIYLHLSKITFI